jgi:hypothetical protein
LATGMPTNQTRRRQDHANTPDALLTCVLKGLGYAGLIMVHLSVVAPLLEDPALRVRR